MKTYDVAIVGGGLSGILAARTMVKKGVSVIVIDKSKSVGGRMATRRHDGGKADHGAQFFTVRSQEFQSHVDEWVQNGWVESWFGEKYARYKGIEGMNQLVKNLSRGLPMKLNFQVHHINKRNSEYVIVSEDKQEISAKAILLTPPAPQTKKLLNQSDCRVSKEAEATLQTLTFSPALVALVTLEKNARTWLPDSGHQDTQLSEGLERIVDSYAKGISKERIISIYATPELSTTLYEESDAIIRDELVKLSAPIIPSRAILSTVIKKWRYAQADHVHTSPFLSLSDEENVLVAGDAFLYEDDQSGRTRIESAARSGLAAASEMIQRLQSAST
ncbi:NAD(P)/FAD-dependent oxidoreductase [Guptibacillus algicola]|uniref:NAD(P)/FAD-dependent oxidoreductase n=1 Tax=Guptibacillus algicola TaxID=225844 RepID=UPI001CD6A21B|nr:FAD-dependent oxidoreductase [Alkalihalobacillus algicola]MCA0988844.1 FAD-dependent oxidoreductase [Alkalihalobacillus algicola]